jgi:hypothetical protein
MTTDPVIQSYYSKRLDKALLDLMSVKEMQALAKAILNETKKSTDLVGGEDQMGAFPSGGNVEWSMPPNLPTEARLQPRIFRWHSLTCSNAQKPPCGMVPVSFSFGSGQIADEVFKKFFLASQFFGIPVALDNNIFVGNKFDQVTFRWRGTPFFMTRNMFNGCVLELPNAVELPPDSELNGKCHVRRTPDVDIFNIVGARPDVTTGPCTKRNPDNTCAEVRDTYIAPPQP